MRIDPILQTPDPALVQCASVSLSRAPVLLGIRIHSVRRSLSTADCGRAQCWRGPVEEIRPGDVVWFAPAGKHRHGATPTTGVTHFAIQGKLDGRVVDWLDQVSDEQYRTKSSLLLKPGTIFSN